LSHFAVIPVSFPSEMAGLDASSDNYLKMMRIFEIQSQLLQALASFENLVKGYGQPETKVLLPLNLDKPKKKSCKVLEKLWGGSSTEIGQICDILSQIAGERDTDCSNADGRLCLT
jgi:hypothetical protein